LAGGDVRERSCERKADLGYLAQPSFVEAGRARFEQLRLGVEEALALIEACRASTLLDALRMLSSGAPGPLRAYVVGEELVVAAGSYSLLGVSIGEGRVRMWEDWRDRLAAAARDAASAVAKRLMTITLDRGEEAPAELRDVAGKLAAAVEKGDLGELEELLKRLRSELQGIAGA
jgi:hypothetical protein